MRDLQFEFKIVVNLRSLMPYLTSSADPVFHGKEWHVLTSSLIFSSPALLLSQ